MSNLPGVNRLALIVALLAAPLASIGGIAVAQPTTAVFVHGFGANGSTWDAAAQALRTELAIGAANPTLPESDRFVDQAYDLNLFNWSNAVLIGHSNGGLVSREASRNASYAGIITVGTLHGGAPIANRLDDIQGFGQRIADETGYIQFVDFVVGPQTSAWGFVALLAFFAASVVDYALENIFDSLSGKPVLDDMKPGSQFLNSLNDPSNLSREASMVRVGIVVSADDDYSGGPFRLVTGPGAASNLMQEMIQIGYEFEVDATDNLLSIDYTNWNAGLEIGAAYATFDISSMLTTLPEQWCDWIGAYDGTTCGPSDALVPVASQVYPGAVAVQISGPSHTEETQNTFVYQAIKSALVTRLGVPTR